MGDYILKLVMRIKKVIKSKLGKTIPVYVPVMSGSLLVGKTAIITGGTSGIGYAIASSFLKNGASIIITGRNLTKLNNSLSKLTVEGEYKNRIISGFVCDNRNIDSIKECFELIKGVIGSQKLDILVNNAGVLNYSCFAEVIEKEYDDVLDTNLKGTYFWSQIVSNYFIKYEIAGNILNIGSSSCLRPAISPYTLSKWGLKGLTQGLAKALIPYGIVVNGVAPGQTLTAMAKVDMNSGIKNSSIPAGRYLLAEEIANIAVVLASALGRMIVGDIVYVTGGAGTVTYDDISYFDEMFVKEANYKWSEIEDDDYI